MNDKSMNTMKVKQINKNKVYNYIFENKTTCKLDITKSLNMGLSTVNQNLKSLEQQGLITKNGFFESTGGRKAEALEIIPDARISIGIAILKESFDMVAINMYGNIVATKTILVSFQNDNGYFKLINDNLNQFINENNISNILGVSVAMQGIISNDGNSVSYGEILDNEGMSLEKFSNHIQYPLRMEHDSKAAAVLELWNNKDVENATVFLLNRNMGGAIICGKEVQSGDKMRTGIIEHICVDDSGDKCYCGQNGCLETYCSASSLKKKAGMDISDFFDKLRAQDEFCIGVWKDYLDKLAQAIRLLSTVIDGKIIISGYIAWYFNDDDIEYLLEKTNQKAMFKLGVNDIIVSKQGSNTQAIGTALYYVKDFLTKI